MMSRMLRLLTAGRVAWQGPRRRCSTGCPADVPVSRASRSHRSWRGGGTGHGRGGRQRIEADTFEILAGVRHGRTMGSPVAVTIANVEFEPKYRELMGAEGNPIRGDALTRPRPGHADLVGALKYGFDDVRNVLERASARETAARVAAGAVCKAFLGELGVEVLSHVVRIGKVKAQRRGCRTRRTRAAVDRFAGAVRRRRPRPTRWSRRSTGSAEAKDTLGGVFEVLAYGVPPGLGSYVHWDRKLDARLAAALMSIQSVKGVEVGDGFATAARAGLEGPRRDRAARR